MGMTRPIHTDAQVEGSGGRGAVEAGGRGAVEAGGRGALVVMEGCDRTGKTTQAKMLVESLNKLGKPAVFMCFPDRDTPIGGIINSYLSCQQEMNDRSIHLLFSANRWESLAKITSNIEGGVNVIIDRYAFSGVAFSAAKEGMTLEWCKKCDVGLPKPDLVLFLDLTPEEAGKRGQWGEERYEKESVQKIVRENYNELMDSSWKVIDANKTIDDLQEELKARVIETIDITKDEKLKTLWTE